MLKNELLIHECILQKIFGCSGVTLFWNIKSKDVTFLEDSCDVRYGKNFIIGNLEKYKIRIEPNDFDGLGFDVILESQSMPYRPQDGVIKAGNDYFAWLAAVPKGSFKGDFFYNVFCNTNHKLID